MLRSLTLLAALVLALPALAVPHHIAHQGRFLDSVGAPVDGAHDVTVRVFDAASGGQELWSDTFVDVPFSAGHYALVLGSGAALDPAAFAGNATLWIEIALDDAPPMPERLRLTSVPFALHAGSAARAASADSVSGPVEATTLTADSVSAAEVRVGGAPVVTDWSNLPGVPADLSDGDADTLAALSCADGQLAVSEAGAWRCGDDADTPYDLGQLTADLAANPVDLAGGSTLDGERIATVGNTPAAQSWSKVLRVRSRGYSAPSTFPATVSLDGVTVHTTARSYGLVVIDRATGAVESNRNFDVYGAVANAEALATALAEVDHTKIVVINTNDEPAGNRLSSGLDLEMLRCGASSRFTNNAGFRHRSAYALVGICGQGPGTGLELYSGDVDNSASAAIDLSVVLSDGNPQGHTGGAPWPSFTQINNSAWSTGAVGSVNASTWTRIGAVAQTVNNPVPSLLIATANGHIHGGNDAGRWVYATFFWRNTATGAEGSCATGSDYGQFHMYGNVTGATWAPLSFTQMCLLPAGNFTVDLRFRTSAPAGTWQFNGVGAQIATIPTR